MDRPGTLPTLGSVVLEGEQVTAIWGAEGVPPRPGLFQETDLCGILRMLDALPRNPSVKPWNPLPFVRVVNHLRSLGKVRAYSAIREYLRVARTYRRDEDEPWEAPAPVFFPLLRVLFEVPDERADELDLDYAGVLVQDGIPFQVGFTYGDYLIRKPGLGPLGYYWSDGSLRSAPLRPCDNPHEAAARLEARGVPRKPHGAARPWTDEERWLLREQALRLCAAVLPIEPDASGNRLAGRPGAEALWWGMLAALRLMNCRWDPAAQQFTFLAGYRPPDFPGADYRKHVWVPPGLGGRCRITLWRSDEDAFVTEMRSDPSLHLSEVRFMGINGERIPMAGREPRTRSMDGSRKVVVDVQAVFLRQGSAVRLSLPGNPERVSRLFRP